MEWISILALFISWIQISIYRFELYSEYIKIEEQIRICVATFGMFNGTLKVVCRDNCSIDIRNDIVDILNQSKIINGLDPKLFDTFETLKKIRVNSRNSNNNGYIIIQNEIELEKFNQMMQDAETRIDCLLKNISKEKQMYEGCIVGAFNSLVTLTDSIPPSTISIVRGIVKKTDNQTHL